MAKSMKKGGPTSEDRAKYGKNVSRVMNQTGSAAKAASTGPAKTKGK